MTSTELVPAGNMAALESLDAASREIAVTSMLSEARSWLAHAVEATEPRKVAEFKAFVATIAESTKQLGLSKEIQLDAGEMVRRAERGVGVAIRRGQEKGEIRTKADGASVREFYRGSTNNSVVANALKPSPDEFVSKHEMYGNASGIAALTDGVSDEEFDEALGEAKAEGNVSRANVVSKLKPKPTVCGPTPSERPEHLRGTHRIDGNRVISATVLDASNVVSPSLIAQVDFAALDREQLGEWISSLSESEKALRSLRKSLEKELHHG